MMANGEDTVDLLVVGGGINGVGIARDAAGRGLSVALCEQGDLGGATSSASTKLVHGGLRDLEHVEFRLVRESLAEREALLAAAPHIVRPLRFVLPHRNIARPAWMVRLGLFLYDHLAPHPSLPGCRRVDLRRDPAGGPLKDDAEKGFEYFDCWVDDARLVVLNAMQAAALGAKIMTRTRLMAARRGEDMWEARLLDLRSDAEFPITARALINVAGPWAHRLAEDVLGLEGDKPLSLVKGSHFVVPRIYADDHALILQNPDGRVVFIIPFEGRFSLIGTTEVPFAGDPARVAIDDQETDYLLSSVNAYLARPVKAADIVWDFAGVRPLFGDGADDPTAITRDYVLEIDMAPGRAGVISVFGGKITTYRRLAEKVVGSLAPRFPALGGPWTEGAVLPGGDFGAGDWGDFTGALAAAYPDLDPDYLEALARRHGSRVHDVLGPAQRTADLGVNFGGGLYQCEVDYLIENEWAETADDVLWRRTKAGLAMDNAEKAALQDYMSKAEAPAHAAP
ncbi:MAG: glycerol-3-phosphate dehydrogenase [Rhodospirillales bacterium]